MNGSIKPFDADAEYFIDEGCFITELSNSADDPDVSIASARVEPGVTTRWHRLLDTVERYYIISGSGRMELGDKPAREVHPGDVVVIPPLCKQRIKNTGTGDLIFLAICSPRFRMDAYQDIDERIRSSQKGAG